MNKKAFTLIELLVVVLIIGILSAVALPQYEKAVVKSRYATLKFLTRAIADAEERYYLANNEYTNDFDDLDVQTPAFTSETKWDNNERSYRYFDWGDCHLTSKVVVTCENSAAQMRYQIRFLHSGNSQECVARNTDLSSVQNQICKAETGRSSPSDPSTNYTGWNY